ncbi:hypothetical protein EIP91_007183 [Steccherinum ochraceum]|uniref:Protein kinase domain-containing protein n=1 Tax=Steccherinum ochraceum TaxID=92696 RepID=A0A4R0RUV2_9APHY|nr:hypothetical protein EIP91_007183 [Steccherinum ochraceum]
MLRLSRHTKTIHVDNQHCHEKQSIQDAIFDALQESLSHSPRLLSLGREESQAVLDKIWTLLELPLDPHADAGIQSYLIRNKLRRTSLKISIKHDILPSTLFLEGVKCTETEGRGSGSFAEVFYGSYGDLPVAIKRLRVYVGTPEPQRLRIKQDFCRETLLWKNLAHKHILPFLGVSQGTFTHCPFCMVLPWMENGSIRNYISVLSSAGNLVGRRYSESVDEWLYQISQGLAYLHEEGIIHGDLHGGNILIDDNDTVRLTDFGMALIGEATSYNYASVHGGGATRWQAPEVIDPEEFGLTSSRPTYASDVYSLGIVCVELYMNQRPFADLTERQVAKRIVAGVRPPRPSGPNGERMSPSLWHLVTTCWREVPALRPPIGQVCRSLSRISLAPSQVTYGRDRPSTSELHRRLSNVFVSHPEHITVSITPSPPQPVLTPKHLSDPLSTFKQSVDFDIFTDQELELWCTQLATDEHGQVVPRTLLQLITTLPWTMHMPRDLRREISQASPIWARHLWAEEYAQSLGGLLSPHADAKTTDPRTDPPPTRPLHRSEERAVSSSLPSSSQQKTPPRKVVVGFPLAPALAAPKSAFSSISTLGTQSSGPSTPPDNPYAMTSSPPLGPHISSEAFQIPSPSQILPAKPRLRHPGTSFLSRQRPQAFAQHSDDLLHSRPQHHPQPQASSFDMPVNHPLRESILHAMFEGVYVPSDQPDWTTYIASEDDAAALGTLTGSGSPTVPSARPANALNTIAEEPTDLVFGSEMEMDLLFADPVTQDRTSTLPRSRYDATLQSLAHISQAMAASKPYSAFQSSMPLPGASGKRRTGRERLKLIVNE